MRTLEFGSEVELAVRSAGFMDFNAAKAISSITDPYSYDFPNGELVASEGQFFVPSISVLTTDYAGSVTASTAVFGLDSAENIREFDAEGKRWLEKISNAGQDPANRPRFSTDIADRAMLKEYAGARSKLLGGLVFLKPPGDNEAHGRTFLASDFISYHDDVIKSKPVQVGRLIGKVLARTKGYEYRMPSATDLATLHMQRVSRHAVQKNIGPIIVDRALKITV